MKQERRIPTIVAILVLFLGLGGLITFIERRSSLSTSASAGAQVRDMRITNITDSSVAISWLTDQPVTGSVVYGEGGDKRVAEDDRDGAGQVHPSRTHYATIHNLIATTDYSFRLLSSDQTFDDSGKPYRFTTGPKLGFPQVVEPSYGKVATEGGQAAGGTIIYLTVGGSAMLSTLSRDSGEWLIPLSTARTLDEQTYASISKDSQIEIRLIGDDGSVATVITDTQHDSPTPMVTLGKTYNFRLTARENAQSGQNQILGVNEDSPVKEKIAIIAPAHNSSLTSSKPLIRGLAMPGKIVRIVLESKPQIGEVIAGSDGKWAWAPEKELSPGAHVLTMRTTDATGKEIVKIQRFIVLKSGTQVLGETTEATPSGTVTPTKPPATVPTMTPALTITISPSLTPSQVAPSLLTPTPTPVEGLPRSGNVGVTVILLLAGATIFLLGVIHLGIF